MQVVENSGYQKNQNKKQRKKINRDKKYHYYIGNCIIVCQKMCAKQFLNDKIE